MPSGSVLSHNRTDPSFAPEFYRKAISLLILHYQLVRLAGIGKILTYGMFALFIAGCARSYALDYQPATDDIATFNEAVSQTFFIKQRGLSAVELVVESHDKEQAAEAFLYEHPGGRMVAQAPIRVPSSVGRQWVRIAWPQTVASSYRSLRLEIRPLNDRVLRLGTGRPDSYVDGSLYVGNQPVNAQLTFRLVFSRFALLAEGMEWLWFMLQVLWWSVLVFVLPGWGLVAWLRTRDPEDLLNHWAARLCMAAGASIALYPLLYSWFDLLGLSLGIGVPWLAMGLGLASLCIRTIALWRDPGPQGLPPLTPFQLRSSADVAFLVVVGGLVITRLGPLSALQAPFWGDSVQHAFITQLMLDRGGLFNDWRPYADFLSFTHQFGFHANMAAYGSLRHLTGLEAVLEAGQILNVIGILALYPITVHVAGGNKWAGLAAMICGGLLSYMPAMYINWGRYAQLSGQAALPVAMLLLWRLADARPWQIKPLMAAGAVLAGMALCYYRMPLFMAAFALLLLMLWIAPNWGWDIVRWQRGLASLMGAAALGALLTVPHFFRLYGSFLVGRAAASLQGAPQQWVWNDYQIWRSLPDYYPRWLQQWAGWAWLWSVVVAHRKAFLIGAWGLSLGALVALSLLQIPLMSELQNFAVVIAMYIPFSILCGWSAGWLLAWTARRYADPWARRIPKLAGALCLLAVLASLPRTRDILDEQYNMVTRPDRLAMDWIRENTPADARFFVSGYRVYGGRTVVGADAGWWIPLLAHRANSMPPQYALLERPADENQVTDLVNLIASLEGIPLSSPWATKLLCEQGYTHVFLGQKQGKVGFEVRQLYSEAQLAANPSLRPVYRQDRVRVYAVNPEFCADIEALFTPVRPPEVQ